jgi:ComF family protein
VRSARSYCWIGAGAGKDIVHALKYESWTRAAEKMGERMSRMRFPADVEEEHVTLIPIPLSASRKRERGFNQSELLAAAVAKRRRLEMMNDVLHRETAIRSQTQLTPGERLSNVAGAFSVSNDSRSRIRGRHLMLVDDVITTGATLRAAAEALFAAGARTISYMTFGRAPASGDRLFP